MCCRGNIINQKYANLWTLSFCTLLSVEIHSRVEITDGYSVNNTIAQGYIAFHFESICVEMKRE